MVAEQPISLDYENHTAVYEHFNARQPDVEAVKRMHLMASMLYRPHIEFAEGAETAMRQDSEANVRYIFASNHSRMDDQFPYAALMQREEVFHRFIGNTIILSKIDHFNNPHARSIIEKWNAIPVYRQQDVEEHKEVDSLQVARELQNTVVSKIVSGMSLFLFPEGTRKQQEQDKLSIVKKGLGRFACDAYESGAQVSILPMGLYWGDSDNKRWLRRSTTPNIYVGMPIRLHGKENTPSGVMAPVRRAMTEALDKAKAASDKRSPTARLAAYRLAKRHKVMT